MVFDRGDPMSEMEAGPAKRLGILQCDSVPAELQAQFADYPDMFQRVLAGGRPLEFCTYDLPRGQFPESLDECDAWLFTGSRWSAYDPVGWIAQAHDLVRGLHAERRPSLGVCFGHQLIARALGGQVSQAEVGWGVGIHTARIIERRPWMTPGRANLPLLVSHQDQVSVPPEDAQVLASHDFCPYDMLQVGEHILTFQGHPEFPKEYSRALIELRREVIGEPASEQGLASLRGCPEGDIAAGWIRCFLERAWTNA